MNEQKALSQTSQTIKNVIEAIAIQLQITKRESFSIRVNELQTSTTITVQTHDDDYGKICGTGGVMINALKLLSGLIAQRFQLEEPPRRGGRTQAAKVRLVLDKPIPGDMGPRPKFKAAENWSNEPIKLLAIKICEAVFSLPVALDAVDAGDSTTIEIAPAENDPALQNENIIETSLTAIFHAIGKAQGRNEIFIDVAVAAK